MNNVARDSTTAAWDEFLASSPRGQYQQASGWAHVKALDGWATAREYLNRSDPRAGGFQLLWKPSRFGRIGYVSKGPVLPVESELAVGEALGRVADVAHRLQLAAVVVQPPNDSAISSEAFVRHGFFSKPVRSVIRSTGVIWLDGGVDGVVRRLSRTARHDWRNACRQGVTLRWGTRDDLPLFFGLMSESCRRQNTNPNPDRVELLEALWDAFPDKVRLAFAEHGGRTHAGILLIEQRDTLLIWKKGWNSEQPRLFTNQFVNTECLIWAATRGFVSVDVAGMAPEIAAGLLSGRRLAEEHRQSRDVFHLRLGARPRMLPPAHLLVVSPALRRIAYAALRWSWLRNALERRVA